MILARINKKYIFKIQEQEILRWVIDQFDSINSTSNTNQFNPRVIVSTILKYLDYNYKSHFKHAITIKTIHLRFVEQPSR